jgi:hypothetical protein
MVIVAIVQTFLPFIAQAETAKQDLQAFAQPTLQSDAWVWHCFGHPWPEHGDVHDVRFVVHVCAHVEAVVAHAIGHDASGIADPTSAAGWVSAASAVSTTAVAPSSAASASATLRAPSFTISEHPFDRRIRTIGAHAFTT